MVHCFLSWSFTRGLQNKSIVSNVSALTQVDVRTSLGLTTSVKNCCLGAWKPAHFIYPEPVPVGAVVILDCCRFCYLGVVLLLSGQKGEEKPTSRNRATFIMCTPRNGLQRQTSPRTEKTPQAWSSQLPLTPCYVFIIITVRKWMNLKKIRCLGIPVFWGSGLAEYKGKR